MFDVKVVLCLVSVNFFKNEKYVLSTSDSGITLPNFKINNVDNITSMVKEYVSKLFVDEIRHNNLDRIKFISFNDIKVKTLFPEDQNTIQILYGGAIPNLNVIPDYHWFPFDYMNLNIQKELSIINTTIQHVI